MAGIAIAGTLAADVIKMISDYPKKGMLADIYEVSYGVGGCAANTAAGVKRLDPSIPVKSIGLTGDDEMGRFLKAKLEEFGIDTSMIRQTQQEVTSFSDVMTVRGSGERTFFHNRGACRLFGAEHLEADRLDAKLVLIGYGGMLDALNLPDEKYQTVLARVCHDLKEKGIQTAMDVASLSDAQEMRRLVLPALPYLDYLIINEMEGAMLTDMEVRDAKGQLIPGAMEAISRRLMELGVQECCVLHAPEMGCAVDKDGIYCEEPSLDLPQGYIVGAVGAGDAFCAGILYSVYRGLPMDEALRIAAASAAANLSAGDSVSGLRSAQEVRALYEAYRVCKK
ncbi:MAG: carbohydrate kinase family protein [Lachnospiraceae bacterium]|uniref:carbohydrate kinase family protein n=1 Tax=Parablautia sp. Marseille-Q6255 TaxID=3039593 RepID=UPI0024BD2BC5|nr:carbohydrate kinase family protein [Parablautia sp. Marseille-Q6255]